MLNSKEFITDHNAALDAMGEILMTLIVVIFISSIAMFVVPSDGAVDIPHVQVREGVNIERDIIYLEHGGGEFLESDDFEIIININGQKHVFSSEKIHSSFNGNSWQLGDKIEINTIDEWGIDIKNEDDIRIFIVDIPSKQVIQYLKVSI